MGVGWRFKCLALPTPRLGYSEHNHSGEQPGWALLAASFSPTLRAAHSHSKDPGVPAENRSGGGVLL